MHRSRRTATGLIGIATLVLVGTAPASAATWSFDDVAGDVEQYTVTFDEQTGEVEEAGPDPVPEDTSTDVTRVTVQHLARRVVLQAQLRDISLDSGEMDYEIRTDGPDYFAVQRLGADRSVPAFRIDNMRGRRVACDGVSRSVDREAEVATVSIPRRCLSGPSWVRVGAGAASFRETEDSLSFTLDDGLLHGPSSDFLTLSPRIRRG